MGSWATGIAAITLFCEDLAAERAFYHDIFGLSMVHEDPDSAAFRFGGTLINLLDARAAAELIAPEEIGAPASVRAQMTIDVDDVDARCAALAAQGVELLNDPMDRPWGVRTALFADPAGHLWEVAQDLS